MKDNFSSYLDIDLFENKHGGSVDLGKEAQGEDEREGEHDTVHRVPHDLQREHSGRVNLSHTVFHTVSSSDHSETSFEIFFWRGGGFDKISRIFLLGRKTKGEHWGKTLNLMKSINIKCLCRP